MQGVGEGLQNRPLTKAPSMAPKPPTKELPCRKGCPPEGTSGYILLSPDSPVALLNLDVEQDHPSQAFYVAMSG